MDISSAFCVFLYKLFKDEIEREQANGRDVSQHLLELEEFGRDIENRKVYEKFGKKGFLSLMNASEEIDHIRETAEKFAAESPLLAKRLRNMKARNQQKLYHLLVREQTKLMEKAVEICKEWGFDAGILGDELGVPEHEAERVKDLLLDLIYEETGLKAWVKIGVRSPEGVRSERIQYQEPEEPELMTAIFPEREIDAGIVERAAELFGIVRMPFTRDGQKFIVPEEKSSAAANLYLNVINNRVRESVTIATEHLGCGARDAA